MPLMIQFAILLRVLSLLVFIIAAIVAGVMNRPVLLMVILAALMALTNFYYARHSRAQKAARGEPTGWLGKLGLTFVARLITLAIFYGLAVLISALFQETYLARQLAPIDGWVVGITLAIALLTSEVSKRMLATQVTGLMGGMMADMQAAMAKMQQDAGAGDDGFTIDGESHEVDDPANDR